MRPEFISGFVIAGANKQANSANFAGDKRPTVYFV